MAESWLTQDFTGGFNGDADAVALDLPMGQDMKVSTCATAQNFLFERGLAITRPGLATFSTPTNVIPSTHQLLHMRGLQVAPYSLISGINQRGAFGITRDGGGIFHLYSFESLSGIGNILDAVEITGPGFPGSPQNFQDWDEVNGAILVANTGGALRWLPGGTTYTVLNAASGFFFITGHYARAVGAWGPGDTTNSHQTIGWSAQGDETNWTTLDSGVNTIADIPDAITGIKVIKGLVLLARTYGFHIGWATGQFPIVYNWRKHSEKSVGVMYPDTLRIYKDIAFFMSEQGIHTFDLVDIEDIGEGIFTEIFGLIKANFSDPVGFITRSYNNDYRPAYNIVLNGGIGVYPAAQPHYMYDLVEKKWSRHTYASSFSKALDFTYISTGSPGVSLTNMLTVSQAVSTSPTFPAWTQGTNSDQVSSLTTAQVNLTGEHMYDKQLERVLVVYKNGTPGAGSIFNITLTVTYVLNGGSTTTQNFSFATSLSGGWDKRWVDIRLTGDFFQVKVSVPTNAPQVKVKQILMKFSTVGKVRP